MNRDNETIFALSSGHGRSGVAVVRVSGPGVRFALETMCGGVPEERVAALRPVRDPGSGVIDKGLVIFFKGPRSFTGEDMAEFQVHGGRAVVDALVGALGDMTGFRPAEAGEFARRAFDNAKLDLAAVEGLADLVDAETQGQRRAALVQADGMLSDRYEQLRQRMLELRALAEACIDFSDEGDVAGDLTGRIGAGCSQLAGDLAAMLAGFARGRRIREGLVVAVAGKPNAGKSSLVNWLADREIAIVSDEPGTTRDLLEARLDIAGIAVSVFDTAGLRDDAGVVEAEGIRRARELMVKADLVIELVDSDSEHSPDTDMDANNYGDKQEAEHWRIASKADLRPDLSAGVDRISTSSGEGLERLLDRLEAFARDRAGFTGEAVMTRERHRDCAAQALAAVERCGMHLREDRFELAAEELRMASDAMGRLTGAIHTEDVLGKIFSSFCIGK